VDDVHKRWVLLALASGILTQRFSIAAERDIPTVRALLAEPSQLAQWLADQDPAIVAAQARVDAAVELREQATTLPNPQLTASAGGFVIGHTNPRTPRLGLGETTAISAGLTELVELGKRGPRQRAARLRADAAAQLGAATLSGRLSEATLTLGKLAYVSAKRAVVAENLRAAQTLASLEKIRRDHADLSGAEYSRIELETQQLALQLARTEADVAVAVAMCGAILHTRCPTDDAIDATALDAGAPIPTKLPAGLGVDQAIDRRPGRRAAQLEKSALEADATLASHRAIPDLTLSVGYTLDNLTVAGNQHQTLMFAVGVPLPLFDRGANDAAAARASARAIDAEQRAVVREARGQVEALLAQRTTLEATVTQLQSEALPRSAQIVQQTRHAFDLGQTGLAELLLAERAHRQLVLDVLDTRFDLFNVRAQLRQVLGIDDQIALAVRAQR
jgi:cobalt-zinc-cadmium efflux system outer membrane protein